MNPEWDVLLSASQKNRPDLIRDYVTNRGIDPSHANAVGQSALHIAALWGHVGAVQALVELGANVNAQNNMTGATPLHMVAQSQKAASSQDRLDVIDILVRGGAKVDQADNFGSLPVQVVQVGSGSTGSGTNGDTEHLMQTFIDRLQPQRPELHEAIANRDVATVEALCSATTATTSTTSDEAKDDSSNITNIAHKGLSPLNFAIHELLEVCRTKGKGPNDGVDRDNSTKDEDVQKLLSIVPLLLKHGADVNGGVGTDDNGISKEAAAQLLLGRGDVQEPPLQKVVATLRDALKKKDTGTVEALQALVSSLVEHGAALSTDTTHLLHQAARFNEIALVQFLVETLRVDPNTKGRQGMTPLHFAARSGQVEMVNYLLKLPGIDVKCMDDRGSTALDAARVNQKEDVVQVLQEHM